MRLRVLAVAAAMLMSSLSARADQIFNLNNVTLSSAAGGGQSLGTLTGSFTTDDHLSTVFSFNITASAAGAFNGFTYTNLNSRITAASLPSQYFQIDSNDALNELRLSFTSGLSTTNSSVGGSQSYEHEPSGGNRYVSGMIVASPAAAVTPEPSSLALLGTGFLGLVGAVRRRSAA